MTECIRGECEPKVSANSPGDPGSHLGNQTTEIPVVASPLCVVAHCHLIEKIAYISTRWYTASSYVFFYFLLFFFPTPLSAVLYAEYIMLLLHILDSETSFSAFLMQLFAFEMLSAPFISWDIIVTWDFDVQ